ILVAEDNEINQKVILHQLRLLGRTADIAENGRKALEKWQSGEYSLLLTDLNMPVMSGWELSVAIRAAEHGKSHIPIIALTANALKGEADRCLKMGMDDYLSKPVLLVNLKATLDKWLPPVEEDASIGSEPHQTNTSMPVDVSVLKALVGDDEEIVRDFLRDFQLSAAGIGRDLRVACDVGKAIIVGNLMHKLKSSARTVGALALGELCAEMEAAGKADSNETLALLLPKFEQEFNAVNIFIDSLLGPHVDRHDDK
ncbi:MAG: response regulator, partial [Herbaspirillum sp.]